jgi:hypothetical protein
MKSLLSLIALTLISSLVQAQEITIKVYSIKELNAQTPELPKNCGFDREQFHDEMCFNDQKDCIQNNFPIWGNSTAAYAKVDQRFFLADTKKLKLYLKHMDHLQEIGDLALIHHKSFKHNRIMCEVENSYGLYNVNLHSDVELLDIKKSSFAKKVQAKASQHKEKYDFTTIDLQFIVGADQYKIQGMHSVPANSNSHEKVKIKYLIQENKLNNKNDYPKRSYFEFYFGE